MTAVWLGISDQHQEGHFTSLTSGADVSFTHWFPDGSTPDNLDMDNTPNADCVVVDHNGFWHDRSCTHNQYHIMCEKRQVAFSLS